MAKSIDLTGKTFGLLTVMGKISRSGKRPLWECRCECGNYVYKEAAPLNNGNTKSCGCLRKTLGKKRQIDLLGQRFGRLEVIGLNKGNKKNTRWECQCDCGSKISTSTNSLRTKRTRSCGCLAIELNSSRFSTHGMTKSNEYRTWQLMKSRCYNSNFPKYQKYGGRGIKVCERWLASFENFYTDMGPSNGLTIDRINNDGDYTPTNCRWADSYTQALNKGVSEKSVTGITGVYETRNNTYTAVLTVDGLRVLCKNFKTIEDAKQARFEAEKKYKIPYLDLNNARNTLDDFVAVDKQGRVYIHGSLKSAVSFHGLNPIKILLCLHGDNGCTQYGELMWYFLKDFKGGV